MSRNSVEALGVDVGGVLITSTDREQDTALFHAGYLDRPEVPGAIDALARLARERFGDRTYVVSKCGEATERRTLEWMAHHRFFERTGVTADRVHFCRTREGKAPIAERLGLTHFVDDRLEVLSHLTTVPHRYLFRPDDAEVERFRAHLPTVRRAESWADLVETLARTPRSPLVRSVSWGRMEVEGLPVGKDFKLYPGGGRAWDWSETGTRHSPGIQPSDVEELLVRGATVIVLSRGMDLQLQVDARTVELLERRGVPAHICETTEAVRLYNELAATHAVGGLFHSTC
jgi:hypothetical protein